MRDAVCEVVTVDDVMAAIADAPELVDRVAVRAGHRFDADVDAAPLSVAGHVLSAAGITAADVAAGDGLLDANREFARRRQTGEDIAVLSALAVATLRHAQIRQEGGASVADACRSAALFARLQAAAGMSDTDPDGF